MQNRIAQMHHAWRQLDLLKSIRQPIPGKDPAEGLDKVPPPPFGTAANLLMPIVCERDVSPLAAFFSLKSVSPETEAVACNEAGTEAGEAAHLTSTPPKFSVHRSATLPSACIILPELPPELAEDAEPASPPASTASTPRAPEPATPAGGSHMKRLRKKVSKRLSKVAIDLSELAQKMSPRSGRSSPEKASPVRRASPTKDDPVLASLPIAERNRIAVKMAEYCQSGDYASASPTRQALLFNGQLIGHLTAYPELIRTDALRALRTDLQSRMNHAVVDTVVHLEDPSFSDFVGQVTQANFVRPWTHDSADTSNSATGAKKKNADVLRPTFVRDFDNSDYYFKAADGVPEKISDTDQFIRLIGPGTGGDLSCIVSNIASQNLGNFLKNVLFLRQDADGNSQSVLRLHDGTPIMPLAIAKASYMFSKADDGTLALDYEWRSSAELNSGKALRVKRMAGDNGVSQVQEAELSIRVRLTITPDGQWRIGNPAIHAKGWNMPIPD